MRPKLPPLIVFLTLVLAATLLTSAPAHGQNDDLGVWLALGDSYSSGEGIAGTTADESESGVNWHRKDCQRATGNGTNAKAWAVSAFEAVGPALDLDEVMLVACTGAVSHDAQTQIFEAMDRTGITEFDLVTFSFGGNDVGFDDILKGCLDLVSRWYQFVSPGCDIDLPSMRDRIDGLVGKSELTPEHSSDITLPELYDQVAQVVKPGGQVVVVGYPHLIEEVDNWDFARRNFLGECVGIQASDVPMLRSATGYLNQQIALAVRDADSRHSSNGVRFRFLDISQDPYEYSDAASDRHGLCSGASWLNGPTLGFTSGDIQHERSFHPNQDGHDNVGRVLAAALQEAAAGEPPPESGGPPPDYWDLLMGASIPALCGHEPTTLVDGQNPDVSGNQGHFSLVKEPWHNDSPVVAFNLHSDQGPLAAVAASCNQGGSAWPNIVVFFDENGVFVTSTFLGSEDGFDWTSLNLEGPSEAGVDSLRVDGDELVVSTNTYTPLDASCCPSGGVVEARLRVAGGGVVALHPTGTDASAHAAAARRCGYSSSDQPCTAEEVRQAVIEALASNDDIYLAELTTTTGAAGLDHDGPEEYLADGDCWSADGTVWCAITPADGTPVLYVLGMLQTSDGRWIVNTVDFVHGDDTGTDEVQGDPAGITEPLDEAAVAKALEGIDGSQCGDLTGILDAGVLLINHPVPFPASGACTGVLREILVRLDFDESEVQWLTGAPQVISRNNLTGDLALVSVPGAQGFRNIIISTPAKVAEYERWNQGRG